MTILVENIRHFGIVVNDLEKSLHFYRDLLGLKIEKSMEESGEYIDNILSLDDVKVKTVKLSANKGVTLVELLEFKSHEKKKEARKFYDIGASHIAFTVKNLDDVYQKLFDSGIKFNAKPQFSPDGYAKVTFCCDPDDTPIELVEVLKNN